MNSTAEQTPTLASPDICYRAMQGRDARFDGSFFVGVSSTGIYCRPVCRVKLPKLQNCLFFGLAAQAEKAGFRPCLRCRPELAPPLMAWSTQDASQLLANQAARMLDEPDGWGDETPTVAKLAERLGVSDRHVRRLFEAHFGVSPLQYLQTRRLLAAKQLLADTELPVTDVALVSGFASVRRFNAAFAAHYRLNPSQLRRSTRANVGLTASQPGVAPSPGMVVHLGYRPPYDVAAMLAFMARRALASVEHVDAAGDDPLDHRTDCPSDYPGICRSFALQRAGTVHTGWVQAQFDEDRYQVRLTVAPGLRAVLPEVIHRVRAWLDLNADPQAIDSVLATDFADTQGLRVPGCLDGYELAVRAVLGQQITVAAARTLAQRLLDQFGTPIETPWPEVCRLFPAPAVLAQVGGEALGALGIVRQRQAAIISIAQAVADGRLALHGGVQIHETVEALKALPGIGAWTAQYIAMRALRWPDAFPAGDVALHRALGLQGEKNPAKAAERASLAWKPWRSYAVMRAWQRLEPQKL